MVGRTAEIVKAYFGGYGMVFYFLVNVIALIAFIVFLVLLIKAKKKGDDFSKFKKLMLIAGGVCAFSFIAMIVVAPDPVESENKVVNEDSKDKKVNPQDDFSDDEVDEIEALKKHLKDDYDVSEPQKFAKGDKVGTWRIVKVANGTPVSDYAVDYARAYMKLGEIHYIVNFSLKTTTKLQLTLNVLEVVTTEYVDKEEHDASVIGSGMLYSEEYFNMDSGERITADADPNAGKVDKNEFVMVIKEVITDTVGEGEVITDVSFDSKNLTVVVDMSNAVIRIGTVKDIAELRISSITDAILGLDDSFYNTWETITIDFGSVGRATLDKSMVVNQGYGRFFDFEPGILN